MVIIATCLIMKKEIYRLKANNKRFNFPTQFFLGSITNNFDAFESRKYFLS